jgi:luciferase family oxidoreductase group 1
MRLSVVDTGWPGNVPTLVPELERLGYHRYWTTEHYSPGQSSSPTVLAGIAAGLTTHMRVGTAGVLLRHASPLSVVNDFALLELLYPGRVDMGLAGADAGTVAAAALDDGARRQHADYGDRLRAVAKLRSLACWDRGRDPRATVLGPATSAQPPMWICGSSEASAIVAGELGTAYAFHDQLKDRATNGPAAVRSYRDAFKPSLFRSEPEVVVACIGTVAGDEGAAADLLAARGLNRSSFMGTPDQVTGQLHELAHGYDTDELAIFLLASSSEESLDGYRSLADTVGLTENPPTGANNKKLGTTDGRA